MSLFLEDNYSGAEFSDCRKYRYCLWRIWNLELPKICFIGLNPSTANETKNDATIRRVISFAKSWGYGGVYMLNCFPYISTNPDDLKDFGNTETNDYWIKKTSLETKEMIFAWGNFEVAKIRGLELSELYPDANCLAKNKNGSPKHPLYVANNIQRIKYK
jgi:hypothetical protein